MKCKLPCLSLTGTEFFILSFLFNNVFGSSHTYKTTCMTRTWQSLIWVRCSPTLKTMLRSVIHEILGVIKTTIASMTRFSPDTHSGTTDCLIAMTWASLSTQRQGGAVAGQLSLPASKRQVMSCKLNAIFMVSFV